MFSRSEPLDLSLNGKNPIFPHTVVMFEGAAFHLQQTPRLGRARVLASKQGRQLMYTHWNKIGCVIDEWVER